MDKIIVPDAAIRKWNERYNPEANKPPRRHTHCMHCEDLVSEYGSPVPLVCYICQKETDADDKYDEMFYE